MQRLSGLDASFLYLETPTMHTHVVGVMLLEPEGPDSFSYDRVVEMIRTRLHLLPPFRRRLAWVPFNLSHPVWIEDPDFDLESHIHRIAAPPPGSMQELAEVVADIAATPLDRSRPLWEGWVVEGLDGGKVALVTKIHHAAVDGVTGADLMAAILDIEPNAPDPAPPAEAWQPDATPHDGLLLAGAIGDLATHPVRLAKAANRTVRSVLNVVRQRTAGPGDGERPSPALPFQAPRVRWSASITPHRVVAFSKTSLDDLKAVKNAFGAKVNDVVLAACTESLRQYLIAHDDLPDRPLVATVPVSVHGKSTQPGANQVSAMFVRLPVQLANPVDQLRAILAETREAKELNDAVGAEMLQDFTHFVPPAVFNQAMRLYSRLKLADRHRPIHNLVVSNVPGPPIPLYTAGARVDALYPLGPLIEGAGMNITVLSNMGSVDFGVVACRETVPDVADIAYGFERAVAQLLKEAAAN